MTKENYQRVRNKTIAFRVTPEEDVLINKYVALSGLTKQEYLTANMLHQTITVKGNPRVFKALKKQMDEIIVELKRINDSSEMDKEFIELIKYVENMASILADKS